MDPPTGAAVATPTIRIAEPPLRPESQGGADGAHSTGVSLQPGGSALAGGIYHTRSHARSLSRGSFDRRSTSGFSNDLTHSVTHDVEEGEEWRDGDEKKKQVFKGKMLMWYVCFSVAHYRLDLIANVA